MNLSVWLDHVTAYHAEESKYRTNKGVCVSCWFMFLVARRLKWSVEFNGGLVDSYGAKTGAVIWSFPRTSNLDGL